MAEQHDERELAEALEAGQAPIDGQPETPAGEGEDELARARTRAAEFEDRWKRSTAEFINYKRRTEQERGDLLRGANAMLILELLPVLDDLERALANVPAAAGERNEGAERERKWVEGVELVARKFRGLLERQGVTPIEAVGRPFDPALHEAVAGSGPVVAEEYQRGYALHGRTLRPALVVVGDEPAEAMSGAPAATGAGKADDLQA